MNESPHKFAELLTKAVQIIKSHEQKSLSIIQDELGFALGRNGGSFVHYLRKGNVPTRLEETEKLAQLLVRRQGLAAQDCLLFLRYGGYPTPAKTTELWFGVGVATETVVEKRPYPPAWQDHW